MRVRGVVGGCEIGSEGHGLWSEGEVEGDDGKA